MTMIATFIYLCDICGKIESESGDAGEYEETTMPYPEGWIEAYDNTGNNPKAFCQKCAEKYKPGFTIREYGSYEYKKELL